MSTSESTAETAAELNTELPLAETHRDLGARWTSYRGIAAPADYGDADSEFDAMNHGCAIADRSGRGRLEMTGEDRARFLHGLVTCDVKALEPGQGTYGFVTSVKGRVMSDLVILALEDRLWIDLPPMAGEEISAHLSKYIIVDRVELGTLESHLPLTLIGPETGSVLGLDELPTEDWQHVEATVHGAAAHVVREPLHGPGGTSSAWTLWVESSAAADLFSALVQAGARPAGHSAFDRLRVTASRPLFGIDFDAANFPQETGLDEQAVSYTKGCYLGQEVVARIHYRGGVNRRLLGLELEDGSDTAGLVGSALSSDGRECGVLTSVAETAGGTSVGLSIVHQRAEVGTEVEITGGGSARLVELPFAQR
ncbi:MAG: hypothetical protein AAF560_33640 [Acidobacteriota bacterium]